MEVKKLKTKEYALLKEYAYEMCLKDIANPNSNNMDKFGDAIHKEFNSNQIDKIYKNTVEFPYDYELFIYLRNKQLNAATLALAEEDFGISEELLLAKIKEYVEYNFSSVLDKKMINEQYIYNLSVYYFNYVKNKEKNNKSVDF